MEFKAFISPSAIFLGTGSDCHLGPERKVEYCEPFKARMPSLPHKIICTCRNVYGCAIVTADVL